LYLWPAHTEGAKLKQAIKFDKDPISAPLCPIYNDPPKKKKSMF